MQSLFLSQLSVSYNSMFNPIIQFLRSIGDFCEVCVFFFIDNKWFFASFTDKYIFFVFSYAVWVDFLCRRGCAIYVMTITCGKASSVYVSFVNLLMSVSSMGVYLVSNISELSSITKSLFFHY